MIPSKRMAEFALLFEMQGERLAHLSALHSGLVYCCLQKTSVNLLRLGARPTGLFPVCRMLETSKHQSGCVMFWRAYLMNEMLRVSQSSIWLVLATTHG
jgi:hypothetical protein